MENKECNALCQNYDQCNLILFNWVKSHVQYDSLNLSTLDFFNDYVYLNQHTSITNL